MILVDEAVTTLNGLVPGSDEEVTTLIGLVSLSCVVGPNLGLVWFKTSISSMVLTRVDTGALAKLYHEFSPFHSLYNRDLAEPAEGSRPSSATMHQ